MDFSGSLSVPLTPPANKTIKLCAEEGRRPKPLFTLDHQDIVNMRRRSIEQAPLVVSDSSTVPLSLSSFPPPALSLGQTEVDDASESLSFGPPHVPFETSIPHKEFMENDIEGVDEHDDCSSVILDDADHHHVPRRKASPTIIPATPQTPPQSPIDDANDVDHVDYPDHPDHVDPGIISPSTPQTPKNVVEPHADGSPATSPSIDMLKTPFVAQTRRSSRSPAKRSLNALFRRGVLSSGCELEFAGVVAVVTKDGWIDGVVSKFPSCFEWVRFVCKQTGTPEPTEDKVWEMITSQGKTLSAYFDEASESGWTERLGDRKRDRSQAQRMVVLPSNLSFSQRGELESLMNAVRGTLVDEWSPSVTHVVMASDEFSDPKQTAPSRPRIMVPRTVKYLLAALHRQWIVEIAWVRACAHRKTHVLEYGYQVRGDVRMPQSLDGPRRLRSLPPLFGDIAAFVHPLFGENGPAREQIEEMIRAGGGAVLVYEPTEADVRRFTTTERRMVVMLCDIKGVTRKLVANLFERAGSNPAKAPVLRYQWVLDSASMAAQQSVVDYSALSDDKLV